mmetsp:Transcript_3957/g.7893  ORF Transcript_3957/g.7893 Transcript_3957/m.7893 type:complete len:91 (+) Transcript_3957:524-796(+)
MGTNAKEAYQASAMTRKKIGRVMAVGRGVKFWFERKEMSKGMKRDWKCGRNINPTAKENEAFAYVFFLSRASLVLQRKAAVCDYDLFDAV